MSIIWPIKGILLETSSIEYMILHSQRKDHLLSLRMSHWLGFYGLAEGNVAKPRRN